MTKKRENIDEVIRQAIDKALAYKGQGEVASYIPELYNVDHDGFALSLVFTNGEVYNYGEYEKEFSLQSISKVLSLAIALHDKGQDYVFSKVGSEATPEAFNSLLPIDDKAANAFINAGAITTSSMVEGDSIDDRLNKILEFYGKISGAKDPHIQESVYKSEIETAIRNRAIAYYLKSKEIFEADPDEVLDLYIKTCAIATNTQQIAKMGANLANKGIDISTGEEYLHRRDVQTVISQMASCGMYENSGTYLMEVGIPSKSGVAGGILGVVPGVCGIGVYSPRLDSAGNSVIGKHILSYLSEDLDLSIFV